MCSRVNIRSGKCLVGQMSGRGNVKSVSVGELSSRGCVSRGSVGRGNVQSGKCPDSVFNFFNLALEELLEKQTNFVLGLYSQAFLFLCFQYSTFINNKVRVEVKMRTKEAKNNMSNCKFYSYLRNYTYIFRKFFTCRSYGVQLANATKKIE